MEHMINRFDTNYKKIEDYVSWAVDKRIILMMASYYTARDEEFDAKSFQEVIDVIKKETHWLSAPRTSQILQFTYAMFFSKELDKQAAIRNVIANKKILNEVKFRQTTFTYIAALFLNADDKERQAQNARELYDEMSKKHRFLTSYEDIPTSVMQSTDGEGDAYLRADTMRRYYDELRSAKFYQGNELQALSQILTMDSPIYNPQMVPYVLKMNEVLKANGIKVRTSMIQLLGFLVLMRIDEDKLSELIELYNILIKQKRFKWYKNEALTVAIQLLLLTSVNRDELETLSLISLEMAIQAQFAMITAAAVASAAATSSS